MHLKIDKYVFLKGPFSNPSYQGRSLLSEIRAEALKDLKDYCDIAIEALNAYNRAVHGASKIDQHWCEEVVSVLLDNGALVNDQALNILRSCPRTGYH